MKVGDTVWVARPIGGRVRAKLVAVHDDGTKNWLRRYTVRFPDGLEETLWPERIEEYHAVDALADLVRCFQCADYGQDRCNEHSGLIRLTAVGTSCSSFTTFINACTSATDPITALGDVVRDRGRRPLTWRERDKRAVRRQMRKASRKQNRQR